MREVTIGGEAVSIAATTMSFFYHSREFATDGSYADALQDAAQFLAAIAAGGTPPAIVTCRLLWTMSKTAQHGNPFPDFESWMWTHRDDLSVVDRELLDAMVGEVTSGFFRVERTAAAPGQGGTDSAGERPGAPDAPDRKAHRAVL